ncbi:hypothetical protein ACFLTN_05965 [Chloroflexota bacterium]
MQSVQRVSKTFYLLSIIGGYISGLVLMITSYALVFPDPSTFATQPIWELLISWLMLLVLGFTLFLYGNAISYLLLYKAWKAIQPGNPRTTPGKAVGYMFIPYYNFYWIFQAYWGFAKDYNAYLSQTGATNFRLSEGLFLALPILFLVSIVPFVGFLTTIGYLVVYFIVANKLCDAVNHLVQAND